MAEFSNENGNCDFGYDSLESIVQAAGGYVQPAEDLRPKTLEAARAAKGLQVRNFWLGSLALGLLFAALTGIPASLLNSGSTKAPTMIQAIHQYDLHSEASLRILQAGLDPSWAIYEAFIQLRSQQADVFEESM